MKKCSTGFFAIGTYTDQELDHGTGLYNYDARLYDPVIGMFIMPDSIVPDWTDPQSLNRYSYCRNNPLKYTDPSGHIAETPWDVLNVGLGVVSLEDNINQGKWGWAAVDTLGLIYDGFATAVPFLPAGAGAGLKAFKYGGSLMGSGRVAMDVTQTANIANDIARCADVSAHAAREGTLIHKAVANSLEAGNVLSDTAINYVGGAKGRGLFPDLSWNDVPGLWADLTTVKQWGAHVKKYDSLGEGIPLLYQRGVGLVETPRIYSFAGSALTGSDYFFNMFSEEKWDFNNTNQ